MTGLSPIAGIAALGGATLYLHSTPWQDRPPPGHTGLANVAQSRHPRRQIRPDQEPRLRHRLSGAGAPDDDAARARQARRAQHRGLCHRLSRLAARRPRLPVPARRLAPRAAQHRCSRPRINEDLAATALWGSQQAELRGEGKYDGVFGMWYGKGPGVDRSGDAFRHANFAGTSKFGGVLALMGDDHTAESSTTAHQSEFNFVDVMIPILNPAGVQEIIDYGLYGWAMSRFTGTWVGLKCMHETVEATAVVDGALDRLNIVIPGPDEFQMPEGGLNIRLNDTVLGMEARLHDYKRDAMLAFVRANKLNQVITSGGRNPKIGVITTGKSYLDVRQALDELGIDEVKANDWGLRIDKIACPWPIGKPELMEFAKRPRPHHRGRGEALADRGAGPRGALRHREPADRHRQEGRAGQLAVPGQGRARFQRRRHLHRRAAAEIRHRREPQGPRRAARRRRSSGSPRRRTSPSAFRISAPAARTIPRPWCRRARAPTPASAAITWRSGWTARRSASRRWAARAPTGSARRRSPSVRTCSRTSATAPTTTPATWRCAPRSPRASTSPTRSSTTTPSP